MRRSILAAAVAMNVAAAAVAHQADPHPESRDGKPCLLLEPAFNTRDHQVAPVTNRCTSHGLTFFWCLTAVPDGHEHAHLRCGWRDDLRQYYRSVVHVAPNGKAWVLATGGEIEYAVCLGHARAAKAPGMPSVWSVYGDMQGVPDGTYQCFVHDDDHWPNE